MEYKLIFNKLSGRLSDKRLKHSLGVSQTAVKLAISYGCDREKAKLAGILHDCARELASEKMVICAESAGIKVSLLERRQPVLLHAAVGAVIAQTGYLVDDEEILKAIRLHTTGGPGMSILDKIIYLADFIEPGRAYPGVEKLRELAGKSLNQAVLAAYDQTIRFLIERRGLIHPDTIAGRNDLLIAIDK